MNNDKIRLLLFTGPTGSGKNSLIDVYCKENNIEVSRFRDEKDSTYYDFDADVLNMREKTSYP